MIRFFDSSAMIKDIIVSKQSFAMIDFTHCEMMKRNIDPTMTKIPTNIHARSVRGAVYELKFILPSGFLMNIE